MMRCKTGPSTTLLLVTVILLVGPLFCMMVAANPLPPPPSAYGEGSPYIYRGESSPLYNWSNFTFRSEEISFKATSDYDLSVKAMYIFGNKGGDWINVTITLPFADGADDLVITVDGQKEEHCYNRRSPYVPTIVTDSVGHFVDTATFPVTVAPGDTTEIVAEYERHYYHDHSLMTEEFEIRYLAVTGQLWSEPIESAKFVFEVPKDLYQDLRTGKGVKVKETGDHVRLTIEHNEWVPQENVIVKWFRYDQESIGIISAIVLVAVLVPTGIVLVFVKRRRRQREAYTRPPAHHRSQYHQYHQHNQYHAPPQAGPRTGPR